jgi:hypothetical protein
LHYNFIFAVAFDIKKATTRMLKKILFLLLICTSAYSQVGGKSAYQFLNLITSPRQAALGGKTVTIYDEDVNQVHFNPATINEEMDNHLAINFGSLFKEVTYGTASYAHTFHNLQTFHAGVNYVNYGNFDGYDAYGQSTASFSGSEIALSGGYAYTVPNTDLHIGANAKLISSTLEKYNSFGGAIDLGAIYTDKERNINWGLVLRNIGTQFTTYSGTKENVPFEIIFGFSQELEHVPIRWHLTLENLQQWDVAFSNPARTQSSIDGVTTPEKVSTINNALRHVILGVEFFPKKAFNIRLGYNFRRGEELRILEQRAFSGLCMGFGIKMYKLKFNYSYSRYTLAGNTSLFGLTINFKE